jgi:hypothetical protein
MMKGCVGIKTLEPLISYPTVDGFVSLTTLPNNFWNIWTDDSCNTFIEITTQMSLLSRNLHPSEENSPSTTVLF